MKKIILGKISTEKKRKKDGKLVEKRRFDDQKVEKIGREKNESKISVFS